MSKQVHNGLWVARDGSYGYESVALFNTSRWSAIQEEWLDKHLEESGNEPDVDVISQIDRNEEPEW
jgi:hypothetical protein